MQRIFLAIVALLALAPALADDPPHDPPYATVSYRQLADHQKLLDGLKNGLEHLNVSLRVLSKDPKVKPSDITLEAKLESGQLVSLAIAADGSFTLPSSSELAQQEDTRFMSNLPKGTLQFQDWCGIKTPTVTAQSYMDLLRGMYEFNVAQNRIDGQLSPKAYGLLFAFNEGGHTLTLHNKKGDKVLSTETLKKARKHLKLNHLTGDEGSAFIYVKFDKELMPENPQTTFDVLPVKVVPVL